MRLRTALLAAVLAATVAGTSSAIATDSPIVKMKRSTTVQFQDLPGATGDRVYGQLTVSSGPANLASRCLANQTVLIRHTLTKPGGGSPSPTVVGTAQTDAQGNWELTSYEAAGATQFLYDTFHVQAPKHKVPPNNVHPKRVCLGATAFITTASD